MAVIINERWQLLKGYNKSECVDCPPGPKLWLFREVAVRGSTVISYMYLQALCIIIIMT